jgi:hypothetical protein
MNEILILLKHMKYKAKANPSVNDGLLVVLHQCGVRLQQVNL